MGLMSRSVRLTFCNSVGIGVVKMTVGVRRRTHEKVQYCITALEI